MNLNLQEAMKNSQDNSAVHEDGSILDGRCEENGDIWTDVPNRITNRHYASVQAAVDAEFLSNKYSNGWSPYEY